MCAKKSGKTLKRVLLLITIAVLLFVGYSAYVTFLKPNIYLDGKKYKFIYIPTKSTMEII